MSDFKAGDIVYICAETVASIAGESIYLAQIISIEKYPLCTMISINKDTMQPCGASFIATLQCLVYKTKNDAVAAVIARLLRMKDER